MTMEITEKKITATREDYFIATGLLTPGIVAIVFLALKLSGAIDWAWVWILTPLWLVGAVLSLLCLVFFILLSVVKFIQNRK